MSFHIVEEKRKSGNLFIVRTSFRNENGKSTSVNCGTIGKVDDIKNKYGEKYKEEINKIGNEIYKSWERNNKDKFVVTTYADEEETEDNVYYSAQLYLRAIWEQIGLSNFLTNIRKESKGRWKYDFNELIFFLTSVQLLNSSSKLSAYNNSNNYLIKPDNLTLDSLYDCLDVLADNIDYINNYTYKKVKKYLKKESKLFFYDVTTINMSQDVNENILIGIKKGKEGIYGPVIQIGCVCDQWGLLVGMYIFNGRSNEQGSLKEQVEKIFQGNKSKNVVICTDAGLCSAKNKRYLEQQFQGYIMTQPLSYKKVPDSIRKWAIEEKFDEINKTKEEIIKEYEEALNNGNIEAAQKIYNKTYYKSRWVICESKIYNDETKKEENKIKKLIKSNDESKSLKNLTEEDFKIPKSEGYKKISYSQRLVVSFNLKYYYKQLNELEKDKEKALNATENNYDIVGKSTKDYRRFITSKRITKEGEVAEEIANSFIEEKYQFEKSLCGLYCQATNLDNKCNEIYRFSRNRWQIEYAFRTAKTYQGFGTVYLHTIKHIIGHFELCFLSQQILKTLIYKLYNHIGFEDDMIGKRKVIEGNKKSKLYDEIFTLDKIVEELSNLKTLKMADDNGRTFLKSLSKKNEINTALAEIFKFSVTKKGKLLKEIMNIIK